MKKEDFVYDRTWFKSIVSLAESGNEKRGLVFLKEYLENYPNDLFAITYYIKLLLNTHNVDEAESEVEKWDNETLNINFWKYCISFYRGNYKEAYRYLLDTIENKEEFRVSNSNFNTTKLFLEKQLNILDETQIDFEHLTYKEKQIINYDSLLTIKHINERHKGNVEGHTSFDEGVDIEKLLLKMTNVLNDELICYHEAECDIYYFESNNYSNYNCLKVVTIRETKNIITMFPIKLIDKNIKVNLLANKTKKGNYQKVKRMSQIEKFNKRYGK